MHPIELKMISIKDALLEKDAPLIFIKNALKEYLQDIILFIIYNDPKLKDLILYGGTCLRKFYELNRLSEDLDFETLVSIDLNEVQKSILGWFNKDKFDKVSSSIQKGDHINRITIKFQVLNSFGLSPNLTEKLHVKVEINEKISGKYKTVLDPYGKDQYSMIVKHYDISTLMAGKMLACIDRVFIKGDSGINVKGRDYYDLVWHMQNKTSPNPKKLTDTNPEYTVKNVFEMLDEKVKKINPEHLLIDLEPLFKEKNFIRDWCDNFHDLYKRYRENYK